MSETYVDLQFTSFPEQVQSFVTMLNMTLEDGSAVTGFQQAMQNGNYEMAQQYYNAITNANQKFIDAEKMNTLMQTCIALQRYFSTDIEPYITTKQQEWEGRINQFNYMGAYSPSTQYQLNNFVIFDVNGVNEIYICTKTPAVGIPPTNDNYWRKLSIRGLQGESGVGLSFRYAWDSAQIYYLNDIVTYNNSVWLCNAQNVNQPPTSQSTYWSLIYSPRQVVYPFQSAQPTSGMQTGYLWFELLT